MKDKGLEEREEAKERKGPAQKKSREDERRSSITVSPV